MLEFVFMIHPFYISTMQKINELEIPRFMQCKWTFSKSNMHILAELEYRIYVFLCQTLKMTFQVIKAICILPSISKIYNKILDIRTYKLI